MGRFLEKQKLLLETGSKRNRKFEESCITGKDIELVI